MNELKQNIHQKCIGMVSDKIKNIQNLISELNSASAEEGKSSAGDKHETARAMAQLETEKLHQQLHQFENYLIILKKLNSIRQPDSAQNGSLIKTDKGYFYIAIPLGKITIENDIMVISMYSPLAKEMIGKKINDKISLNNISYLIEAIG